MNPILRYIFTSLDSDKKSIDNIGKALSKQQGVNNDILVGLLLIAGVTYFTMHTVGKLNNRVTVLEEKMNAKRSFTEPITEEPNLKGD